LTLSVIRLTQCREAVGRVPPWPRVQAVPRLLPQAAPQLMGGFNLAITSPPLVWK
jgi:hypothetical protein